MKISFFFYSLVGLLFLSNQIDASVMAYVTNAGSDTISVIDTSTNTVTATVPVGFFPTGIAASPTGDFVYVLLYSDDVAYAINTSTNSLQNTISLPNGSKPIDIAVSPSGFPFITNFSNATISIIDPSIMVTTKIFPVGSIFPIGIAITSDGTKAYVVNAVGPKNVKVINLSTNTIIATINSGTQSLGVAIAPNNSKAYVTNTMQNTVSVINTATNTITANVALAANSFPRGIAVSPSGSFVYVVLQGTSSVAVVDTLLNIVTATIPLTSSTDPYNIAFTPDGLHAYVTQTLGNSIAVIDTTTNTMTGTISVGNFPFDIAIATVP